MPERLLARAPNAWIATGHYARLLPSPLDPTLPALYRGANIRKDQSHYLSTAPVTALARTLFPLGDFASKDAVRDLANRWGMHTGEKKDSMGICFVGVRKGFSGFLGKTIWQCLDVETRSSAHLPATKQTRTCLRRPATSSTQTERSWAATRVSGDTPSVSGRA